MKRPTKGMADPTTREIQQAVAGHFCLGLDELVGSRRSTRVVAARSIAMYLVRQLLGSTYGEIGMRFGGRSRQRVHESCARVSRLLEGGDVLELAIVRVRARLMGTNDAPD